MTSIIIRICTRENRSPSEPEGPTNRGTTKLPTGVHKKSWQVNVRTVAETEIGFAHSQ